MKQYWIPVACVVVLAVFAAGCAGTDPLQGTAGSHGVAGHGSGRGRHEP